MMGLYHLKMSRSSCLLCEMRPGCDGLLSPINQQDDRGLIPMWMGLCGIIVSCQGEWSIGYSMEMVWLVVMLRRQPCRSRIVQPSQSPISPQRVLRGSSCRRSRSARFSPCWSG